MADNKMHVCLEANGDQGEPVYVIYSAKFSDWLYDKSVKSVESVSPPHFTLEAVITGGVPSMGCGVFRSKIVLAGGSVKGQDGDDEKYNGVITYDKTTKQVSRDDVAVMRGGKVRPLLFQLDNKLYALDTSRNPHNRSFEVYYPNQKHWHRLELDDFTYGYAVGELAESEGLSFFSWFVVGLCLCISLPKDILTYLHHAKYKYKRFKTVYDAPLPFPGMAITYCVQGFEDVVLISFSKGGLVEGRRLRIKYNYRAKPVLIFDTKTYSHHHGDLTGCFADFGHGVFSLTTFDDVDIYVHMFKISRRKCRNDEDLNLRLIKHSMHRYKYTDFSEAGHTSFSFAGCFAPLPAGWGKESTEAKLYASEFPFGEREDDDIPFTKCEHYSDTDDVDSMDHGMGTVIDSDTGSD